MKCPKLAMRAAPEGQSRGAEMNATHKLALRAAPQGGVQAAL